MLREAFKGFREGWMHTSVNPWHIAFFVIAGEVIFAAYFVVKSSLYG